MNPTRMLKIARPNGTPDSRRHHSPIEPPGASSLKTLYEIRVKGDAKPYAEGSAIVVFIDPKKQKPVRIPEEIRARLGR